jgi:hypothetical protein|tara:strand:+ start:491 stop:649 length:159 start_codon:yes stop_codon:yes gene_type:complete
MLVWSLGDRLSHPFISSGRTETDGLIGYYKAGTVGALAGRTGQGLQVTKEFL